MSKVDHELDSPKLPDKSFRELADAAPFMIWLSGTDKKCFWFNKTWLDFTGRSLKQECGDGWFDGVHPDDKKSCLLIYESSFDKRIDFRMTYRIRRSDGVYRWIDDVGSPCFNNGLFAGYIGSCTDVSLLVDSNQSLITTKKYHNKAIDNISPLTKKEKEILEHLANGLSGPEIAKLLNISNHTVTHHKKSIFHKLGTTNALKTVNIARKFKLIE